MSEDLLAVRAMRRPLQLPEGVDRNSAREVLEFATRSSYPTAPDPLLAVAHAAVQIILAMHDEIHALVALKQENDDLQAERAGSEPRVRIADAALLRYLCGRNLVAHDGACLQAHTKILAAYFEAEKEHR